jgi:hypothetical protein
MDLTGWGLWQYWRPCSAQRLRFVHWPLLARSGWLAAINVKGFVDYGFK